VTFCIVHLGVGILGWSEPNWPMGDVAAVYDPWSFRALTGQGIVGITEPFVYPQLALVPMLLAQLITYLTANYYVAWALLIAAIDAVAFHVLVRNGRSTSRSYAAGFWLVAMFALGPIWMYRIDGVTVPLAIMALLWLAGRPVVASVLLTVATWMKVWPAALLGAAFIALRRRWTVAVTAALVSIGVVGVIAALGGFRYAFGFVSQQEGRGLQVEAPVTTPYIWMSYFGVPGAHIRYDNEILTYQVTGPGMEQVAAIMTPLMGIVAVAIIAIAAVKAWRGAYFLSLMPPLSLSLVIALIALNKVGSPQFISWLIAPVVLWMVVDRRRAWKAAGAVLVLCILTHFIYPIFYWELLQGFFWINVLLTARNAAEVLLLVLCVIELVRVRTHPQRRAALASV
jgi:hypothetical protein